MEKNERRLFKKLLEIRDLPENRVCADCGARGTVWASVNLGVFLCMTCGSHHRNLGTHISKPKGATGTYWWGEDEIQFMRSHGNMRAKEIYGGGSPPAGVSRDDPTGWKQYLTDKYVHRKYAPRNSGESSISTPPVTPTASPQVSRKFTNQPMTDIDLIHFGRTSPPATGSNTKPVSPMPKKDFFSEFGL